MTKDEMIAKLRASAARKSKEREAQAATKEKLLSHVPYHSKDNTEDNKEDAENRVIIGDKTLYFNDRQQQARMLMREGKEFCLIGAAGTGKTSTVAGIGIEIVARLLDDKANAADIIGVVSFTNRAVLNIKRALKEIPQLQTYCKTIHKMLAYAPEFYDTFDEDGNLTRTMRFAPTFTKDNPIEDCQLIIVEEASMVGIDLFKQLKDAAPNATFIFIGDLNQLDPVMGKAILGYKLNSVPVIELNKVYRQAMNSPIVAFQHNYVLKGKKLGDNMLKRVSNESDGKLTFTQLKGESKFSPQKLAHIFAKYMCNLYEAGKYNPSEDIILVPNNKGFGRIPMNKVIAQHISEKNAQNVHEIICGFERLYYAVGDFVIHDKEEYYIKEIEHNPRFNLPTSIQAPSIHLNRYGLSTAKSEVLEQDKGLFKEDDNLADLEHLLSMTEHSDNNDDAVNQASHIITLERAIPAFDANDETEAVLHTRGDVGKLEFGYAITIHKSQGSEWNRVFFALGKYNKRMCNRELLYTGMTRAKDECHVFYSPDTALGKLDNTIALAIKHQKIPGNTWQEKAKYFKQSQDDFEAFMNADKEEDKILGDAREVEQRLTEIKEVELQKEKEAFAAKVSSDKNAIKTNETNENDDEQLSNQQNLWG